MAIQQSPDGGLRELALFAGAGGGLLAGQMLGHRTVCAVERDAHCATILAQRQNDGILPPFPIWSDVRSFDGRPWRGIVDVVSGGFPCTDISAAGSGAGIEGSESSLWKEMARIVCDVRPRYVFVENSPMLTSRGLDVVLGDLAALGFDARWGVLGAAALGFPRTSANGSGSSLPTPSGVNGGRNNMMGRIDEWGGSSNPLRGTLLGSMCLPEFEELVMGWPIGWTELTPYATDKFREWQQQHGAS